jgi:hypothetical protein
MKNHDHRKLTGIKKLLKSHEDVKKMNVDKAVDINKKHLEERQSRRHNKGTDIGPCGPHGCPTGK